MDDILKRKLLNDKLNSKDRKFIEEQISYYRLLAMKRNGFMRSYCNHRANILEKELEYGCRK